MIIATVGGTLFDFDWCSGFPFSFALILCGGGGKVLIIVTMDSSQGGAKSIRYSTGDGVVGAEIRAYTRFAMGRTYQHDKFMACIAGVINASPFPAMGCCLSLLLLLCRVDLIQATNLYESLHWKFGQPS
jgi:hypothetical protein